ncbi:hypothetical protein BDN70DRAFT_869315 [Pholiota conissans]|uniref:MYND-type domain-containing protein n=1 Tax=Pholiota conissans TaxID=109636 RepID=A0A9P6CLK1_9AGAR|nr:hypothetical protein BDN70DRAFT_869315 [Pholiota conissans]
MVKSSAEPKLSKPLLPPEFIHRIESDPKLKGAAKSYVYSLEAHTERLDMLRWWKPLNPNIPAIVWNGQDHFDKENKRTLVHLYGFNGDILALCELIRCGANPDLDDAYCVPPMFIVINKMVRLHMPDKFVALKENGEPPNQSDIEMALYQCEQVIRILVEQHVDVNKTNGPVSYLQAACFMKNWDLITLFLEHGAKNTMPHFVIEKYMTEAEQARFYSLVRAKSNKKRPLRICPCWSGKTIKNCHSKAQPYPSKFICVCGSGKIYEKCCLRKCPMVEKWDDAHGFIDHYMAEQMCPSATDEERIHVAGLLAGVIEPFADPAFIYALRRSAFCPLPFGSNFSRKIQEGGMRTWNSLVDQYIEEGTDKRSKFDIERAAKIGIRAGALIRTCEGVGCCKVERRDIEALKSCAKCNIAVYCSAVCQRSAWPTHKKVCCTKKQKAQPLPSQHRMAEFEKSLGPEA